MSVYGTGSRWEPKRTNALRGPSSFLVTAIKAGWSEVEAIKRDADLDPLRQRADFHKLVTALEQRTSRPDLSVR
jgi:hypothetical protein